MVKKTSLIRSFQSAGKGLKIAFHEERNFRIQLLLAVCVFIGALIFQFGYLEWVALLIACGMVLSAELFNSVLERLLDSVKPRISLFIGTMKDLMSAAVLITALAALFIAGALFIPRILYTFSLF